MKKLLTIILVLCIAVPTMADTLTVVSDTNVDIVGIYNKAGGGSTYVPTSMGALLVDEPLPPWPDSSTYGSTYSTGPAANSVWDNGTGLWFQDNSTAQWIWETYRSEDTNSVYIGTDPEYDYDAPTNGRVVEFERTFDIPGIPAEGSVLYIAADNCWEVLINDVEFEQADTAKTADWETSNLDETNVSSEDWDIEPLGPYVIPASMLNSGTNTITILAGNEYYDDTDPYETNNSAQPVYDDDPYRNVNPGGLIFDLTVVYDVLYDICGAKFEYVGEAIGSPLSGWTIELYNDVPELTATTVTDVNGEYCFTGLSAGDYFVGEILQSGWTQIAPDEISDWGYYFTLPGGETNWEDLEPLTYNFLNEQIEEPNVLCSFTQGFWGNAGGKAYYNDELKTTEELLDILLGSGPVVVGQTGHSIIFDNTDCILDLLPAGGPVKALPAGDFDCDSTAALRKVGLLKKNKDPINNVLVGQVVALTLNTRYDDNLGGFVLPGTVDEDGVFCVIYEGGCPMQYTISKEIIDLLGSAGATVYDLLDLANAALAGGYSKKELTAINDAVTTINEAFDECVDLIDCPTSEAGLCDNGCDDDFDGFTDCVPGYEDSDCECLID